MILYGRWHEYLGTPPPPIKWMKEKGRERFRESRRERNGKEWKYDDDEDEYDDDVGDDDKYNDDDDDYISIPCSHTFIYFI